MWIRAHKPPKVCRENIGELNSKVRYYFDISYARYLKTDDGKYLARVTKTMKPEIGKVDNFRLIQSKN